MERYVITTQVEGKKIAKLVSWDTNLMDIMKWATDSHSVEGLAFEVLQIQDGIASRYPVLSSHISELGLSERTKNCLRYEGIKHVGDLVEWTEVRLLKTPNLGRKSVNEIKQALAREGLHLGAKIKETL